MIFKEKNILCIFILKKKFELFYLTTAVKLTFNSLNRFLIEKKSDIVVFSVFHIIPQSFSFLFKFKSELNR